jgi:hypothetical protein
MDIERSKSSRQTSLTITSRVLIITQLALIFSILSNVTTSDKLGVTPNGNKPSLSLPFFI